MNFTLVTNSNGATEYEIHKPGCRDIAKKSTFGGTYKLVAETPEDAVAQEIAEAEVEGYDESDYRIFPCCTDIQTGS